MSRDGCTTEKVDTVSFMKEFEDRLRSIKGFRRVSYFGSITSPDKFCAGRSDLDVIIFGDLTKESRNEARNILYELNEKYRIKAEKAVYLHPVPFFMKKDIEETLMKDVMFSRIVSRLFTQKWRESTKEGKKSPTLEERTKGRTPSKTTRLAELLWE